MQPPDLKPLETLEDPITPDDYIPANDPDTKRSFRRTRRAYRSHKRFLVVLLVLVALLLGYGGWATISEWRNSGKDDGNVPQKTVVIVPSKDQVLTINSQLQVANSGTVKGNLVVLQNGTFSGTVTANNIVGNGSGLTDLNASNINGGKISDNLLSSNVALKDANNVFTGNNTFTNPLALQGTLNGTSAVFSTDVSALKFTQNGHVVCDTSGNCGSNMSLNGVSGAVTLQGTVHQVTVTTSGDTVTLSLPQDIDTTSSPTFAGATVNGTVALADGSTLYDDAFNGLTFKIGTRTYTFPTTGGNSQVICTTAVTCASGGGQAVLLAPGSAQTNTSSTSAVFINNTAGGNLVELQGGGVDKFVVDDNGNVVAAGSITANSFTGDGSGLTNVNAAELNGQAGSYYQNAGNINSGTLSDSRLNSDVTTQGNLFNGNSELVQLTASGILPALNGSNLSSVNAAELQGFAASYFTDAGNISSGTLSDSRLSSNVALLNASNTFTGATNTFSGVAATSITQNGNAVCDTSGNCAGVGGGVTTSGTTTSGTIPVFNGTSTITDSIITQASTTVTVAGTLSATTLQGDGSAITNLDAGNISSGTLAVANGGTGTNGGSFTANGVIYYASGALQSTGAGATGDCLVATTSGAPTWESCSSASAGPAGGDLSGSYPNPKVVGINGVPISESGLSSGNFLIYNGTDWANAAISGDLTVSATGVATIANGAVTNAKLANSSLSVSAGTGLTGGGSVALGGSTSLSVVYGSAANTAVQGNVTLVCAAGSGNLSGGGGTITLGTGGNCGSINTVASPSFTSITLSTPLAISSGGTGASTAAGALTNLGAAKSGSNTDITSLGGLSTALPVNEGGTGATTASGARSNLNAAASGTNSDITSLTGVTSIDNSAAALSVGDTGQALTLQGNASTQLTATDSGFTTKIGFEAPTANVTYLFQAAAGGTYDICTTAGNCAGAGGGVTTTGGDSGDIALFTGTQAIGDSILSQSGSVITNSGSLIIQGTNSLALGTAGPSGKTGSITFNNSTNANTLLLQAGATSTNLTFTLPTTAGLSGQCLTTDGSGVLGFSDCLSGSGGGSGGVASLNGLSGGLSIANASGSGSTITIANAKADASTKGIATFNATDFKDNGAGEISLNTTGVSNGNYGSTSKVATFTVNADGQLTAANSVAIAIDASQIASGTIAPSLVSGDYTGITGTGTLSGLTVSGSSNLQGGATVGSTTGNGVVAFLDGTTDTFAGSLELAGTLSANQTYKLPTTGGTICLDTGNCAGSGGGVTAPSPGGTSGYIAMFTGTQTIANSILSQTGTTVSVAGTLSATTLQGNGSSITNLNATSVSSGTLAVAYGGTGAGSFTTNGVVYGNGTSLGSTAAGTTGECLVGNTSSAPTWESCSSAAAGGTAGGDLSGTYPNPKVVGFNGTPLVVSGLASSNILIYNGTDWVNESLSGPLSVSATGAVTIGAGVITNSNLANSKVTINSNGSLSGTGDVSLGSSLTLSVAYGATADTSVQGNTTLVCPKGTGNLSGGGDTITLGNGGTCSNISITSTPSFTGLTLTNPLAITSGGTGASTAAGALTNLGAAASGANTDITSLGGLTTALPISEGGTGATTASGARSNLGAAASGTNGDITSLTGITSIDNTSAGLSVGDTGQTLTLQGNASSVLTATSGSFTTKISFVAPTADVTYRFDAAAGGTYDICTTAGNCAGSGGGVTAPAPGGTNGYIAMFTGTQTIANSILSQSGTTVTVAGTLSATDLQGSGASITNLNGTNISSGTVGVSVGGTGAGTFTPYGVLYGNGTGALQVTAAGATGDCLVGNTSSGPTWEACSTAASGATPGGPAGGDLSGTYPNPEVVGIYNKPLSITSLASPDVLIYNGTNWVNAAITGDVSVSATGVATIGAGKVTNNDLANSTVGVTAGNGLSGGNGSLALGSSTSLSVVYGSAANTAVEGNVTFACPSAGTNLSGGGNTITEGAGGTCDSLSVVNNPSFTGLVTASGGLTVSTGHTFTNAGSTLNTAISIANLATGGSIGTAATTVDVATTFDVDQTTANQTLTIPSPTTTTAGRIIYINNVGTASFKIGSITIPTGQGRSYEWNGTTWTVLSTTIAGTGLTQTGNTINSAAATSVSNDTNLQGSISGNVLDLSWAGTLAVTRGGTGAGTFTSNGILYGNGTGALQVTAAGTTGECLVGNTSSAPTWESCSSASGGSTPGGPAGGDLTGTYPNPTIAKLQGYTLTVTSPSAGDVLQYNGSAFVNGHITNTNLTAGTFSNITGTGALTAGSIVSGFGAITTANNIQGGAVYAGGNGASIAYLYGQANTASGYSGVIVARGYTSQMADLLQLQNSSGTALSGFNANGQLYYKSGSNTVTLATATQANNVTLTIPADTNTTDTLCLVALGNCTGANGGSGNGNYIENGLTVQTANFNIQSAAAGDVGAVIQGAASQSADLLDFKNSSGTVLGGFNASGTLGFSGLGAAVSAINVNSGGVGTGSIVIGASGGYFQKVLAASGQDAFIAAAPSATSSQTIQNGGVIGLSTQYWNGSSSVNQYDDLQAMRGSTNSGDFWLQNSGGFVTTPQYAGTVGLVVQGAASQTADLLDLKNSGGTVLAKVDANGDLTAINGAFTGTLSATGDATFNGSGTGLGVTNNATVGGNLTVTGSSGETLGSTSNAGILNFLDGTNDGYSVAIQTATQANNVTLSIPADTHTTDTICLVSLGNCTGVNGGSGNGNYIENGLTVQTANFNIQSAAAGDVGAVIQGAASQTADLLDLKSSGGTVVAKIGASGAITTSSTVTATGNITSSGILQGASAQVTGQASAGQGTQALASNLYVQSRGTNLVTNGTGLLGNNYNFSNFTFDPQHTYTGGGSFENGTNGANVQSDELIPINPNDTYQLSLEAESTTYVAGAHAYFGVVGYDIDGNVIMPQMYARYPGSAETTLAAQLKPGDTTVQLTSASGWYNGSTSAYEFFDWYGYTNSKGYTYPDYTYTRNYLASAWGSGGISGNTITLSTPWAGPTLAAGTAVSDGVTGGNYQYIAASNVNVPASWTEYSGRIGGIDTTGTVAVNQFEPGAAYIKLLFLMNRDVTGNVTNISDISFTDDSGVFTAATASTVPVIIQGTTSQTAHLLDVTNSAGSILASIDASGNLTAVNGSFTGTLTAGTGLTVTSGGATITAGGLTVSAGGASITGGLTATGTTNINTAATAATTNLGTGAAVQTVTVGSTSGTSTLNLQAGSGTPTGDLNIQTAAGGIINIGGNSVTNKVLNLGSTGTTVAASTVNIATSNAAATQLVTIGNTANANNTVLIQGGTSTTAIGLQVGSGGTINLGTTSSSNLKLGSTGGGSITLNSNTTEKGNLTIQGSGGATLGSTTSAGLLNFLDGTSDGFTISLQSATQANNVALTIPADTHTTDTICLQLKNNCGSGGTGVATVGALDTTGEDTSANGATISGTVLYLQSATASVPGLVNTSATGQTFGGPKTVQASSGSAFVVQNTSSVATLTVDTTNQRVKVGTAGTPTGQLYVSGNVPSGILGNVGTDGGPSYVYVSGNYAYVTAENDNTLDVFDISNPAAPVSISSTSVGSASSQPSSVYVSGHYAYVTTWNDDILDVYDVSDPAHPVSVGSAPTGIQPSSVYVSGHYAYVTNWNDGTLGIYDISNPAAPVSVSTAATHASGNPSYVSVSGKYAYITDQSSETLDILDISNPAAPTSAASIGTGSDPSYVSVSGNYAYVTAASSNALDIFNVSDPTNPVVADDYSTGSGSSPLSVSVQGRYAYVANDGNGTLGIYDISNPAAPATIGTVSTGGSTYGPNSINVQGRYAYVTNSNTNGLVTFDLGGEYAQALQVGSAVAGTLTVDENASVGGDEYIRGGLTVSGSASFQRALSVSGGLNVSSSLPSTPVGSTDVPTLSGAYSSDTGVTQGEYAYSVATDANNNSYLQIFGLANPESPVLVSNTGLANQCSQVVQVSGGYAYLKCQDGVASFDVSNPTNPTLVGSMDITNLIIFKVSGNYLYALSTYDSTDYMAIYNVTNAANPTLVSNTQVDNDDYTTDIAIQGTYAYLTSGDGLLNVWNVKNPAAPTLAGSDNTGHQYFAVAVQGNYAYAKQSNNGIGVDTFDVSNPANPVMLGSGVDEMNDNGSNDLRLVAQGNYVYVGSKWGGDIEIMDVSDPYNPLLAGDMQNATYLFLGVSGNYLYAINADTNQLQVFNLGGEYAQQLQAGGTETGTLQVNSNASVGGDENITGALTVGQGAAINGSVGITTDSTSALQVQNAAGDTLLNADTTNSQLTVNGQTTITAATDSFPSTPVLDNFNRANGSLGVNWTGPSFDDTNNLAISSDAVTNSNNGSGGWGSDAWGTPITSSNIEAYATVSTIPPVNNTVVLDIANSPTATSFSGYYLSLKNTSTTPTWTIGRCDPGNCSTIDTITHAFASGDSFGLSRVGSQVTAWYKPAAGSWTSIGTVTDATYNVNGYYIGLEASDNTALLDNFGGGISTLGAGLTVNGTEQVQTLTNSTTAFQIQNAAGNSILTADTTHGRINVGTAGTPTGQLYVSGTIANGVVSSFSTGSGSDPNDVVTDGNFAFSANHDTSELEVIDITDPTNPSEINSVSTIGDPAWLARSGKYLYVTISSSGTYYLQVFDISDPYNPVSVKTISLSEYPGLITVSGQYAYVTQSGATSYLDVFSVANPGDPQLVGSVNIGSYVYPTQMTTEGKYVFLAGGSTYHVAIVDVSNPAAPNMIENLATSYDDPGVAVDGQYMYVTLNGNTDQTGSANDALIVYNISDLTSPIPVTTLDLPNKAPYQIVIQGRYAYVIDTGDNTMEAIDISDPSSPVIVGAISTDVLPNSLDVQGRYAYIAASSGDAMDVVDLGGEYAQQLQAGGTETGTLTVDQGASVGGDLNLQGGLAVGQSAAIQGDFGASGSATFQDVTNSTTAFQVKNATGSNLLGVDTANNTIVLGNDGTPAPITLRGGVATGSNVAGANLTIAASNGTGTGGSGSIIFQTAGASSSTIPAFVQGATTDGSATSASVAYSSAVQAGDDLIATVGYFASTPTQEATFSLSDSVNGAWTQIGTSFQSADGETISMFVLPNTAAGTPTVTASASGATGGVVLLNISEYSGLPTSSPVDQVSTNIGASTQATAGPTAALAGAGELVIGAGDVGYTGNISSAGSGFTMREANNDGSNSFGSLGTEDMVAGSTAGQSMAMNLDSSHHWAGMVVAFKTGTGSSPTASDVLQDSMVITSAGNVGIGTSSPSHNLDIQGSSGVRVETTTNTTTAFQIQNSDGTDLVNADTQNMVLSVNGDTNIGSNFSTHLMSDNFESGQLGDLWDVENNGTAAVTADTAHAHGGKYAMKLSESGSGNAFVDANISSTNMIKMRAYLYASSWSSGGAINIFDTGENYDDTGTTENGLYLNSSGDLCYYGYAGASACSTTVMPTNTWVQLEFDVSVNASTGWFVVYVNGGAASGWSGPTSNINTGNWNIGTIFLGDNGGGNNTITYWLDDFVADTSNVGSGSASLNVSDSLHVGGSATIGGELAVENAAGTNLLSSYNDGFYVQDATGSTSLSVGGGSLNFATSGGTTLSVNNYNSSLGSALAIQEGYNSYTGAALSIQGNSGNTHNLDLFDIYDDYNNNYNDFAVDYQGHVAIRNGTNNATAFQILNAGGTALFTVDTQNTKLTVAAAMTIGTATNGVQIDGTNHQVTYTGTARHTKTITLTPEYAGAVLDNGGAGNDIGSMTAGFDSAQRESYYQWTTSQSSNQTYDIVIQVPVPSDFSAWSFAPVIKVDVKTSDTTNGTVTAKLYDTTGTIEPSWNSCSLTPGVTTWSTRNGCSVTGTYAPNGIMTLRLHLQAPPGGTTEVGNITLSYQSSF